MGPQRGCPGRRRVLSTAAWLPAVTLFAFVSWFYVFRHDTLTASTTGPQPVIPPHVWESEDSEAPPVVVIRPPGTAAVTVSGSTLISTTTPSSSSTQTTQTTPTSTMPAIGAAPTVTLSQGTYIGATIPLKHDAYPKAVEAFLGIPYAESTADKNRFRPAIPVTNSTSTFDAVSPGPACPGSNSGRAESEDCLNLNVYRPVGTAKKEGLPVVVYVHGGAFNMGYGMERNMASFVSWAREDIVAVSFNYRVGAFGFLPSALTAKEGLLNLGLKDQQVLFEWVRTNIAAFGGDPENVTLMGLSAGAHSVGHHLMYYSTTKTQPPFAKAILESGATTARAVFYPTHPRHLVQFREFLIAAGIAGVPEREIFSKLRTLSGDTILAASRQIWDKYTSSVTWPFQPVIDGPNAFSNSSHAVNSSVVPLIPDLPLHSWQAGRHLRIPVLTGFNTNEGTSFIPPMADTNADFRSFFSTLIPGFTNKDLHTLETLYPDPVTDPSSPYGTVPAGMGRQWARLDAAYSHYAYICPVLQTAHFLSTTSSSPSSFSKSSHGSPAKKEGRDDDHSAKGYPYSPVYVYRFAALSKYSAANHADEAPLVAHDPAVVTSSRPGIKAISDAMHLAWTNFIVSKDGNPNRTPISLEMGEWPLFESPFDGGSGRHKEKGRIAVFGEGNDERVTGTGTKKGTLRKQGVAVGVESIGEEEGSLEKCRFWWERVLVSEGTGQKLKEKL